jgi:hypothetical protein
MTPTLAALALATLWCLAWAPFFWCCCATDCTTTVPVNVKGCNSTNLSGVTVLIKVSGTTIASGSTDASGNVTLTPSSVNPQSATLEIAAFSGFAAYTTNITLNCTTQSTRNIVLTPAATHVCSPCCGAYPISRTLIATTVAGDVTLTYDTGVWGGTRTANATKRATCSTTTCTCSPTNINADLISIDSGNVNVTVQVYCVLGDWKVLTGISIAFGRTSCSGAPDWGLSDTCTDGTTVFQNDVRSVDVVDGLSGTCSNGDLSLSGSVTDPPTVSFDCRYNNSVCSATTPCPTTIDVDAPNPLTGSISVVDA